VGALGVTKPRRRFPPPWTVGEFLGISYIVRDANNFPVAYVYFESEPGRRAAANLMTKDEARTIAAATIAKLPELVNRKGPVALINQQTDDLLLTHC
jgi:hypothetical protein